MSEPKRPVYRSIPRTLSSFPVIGMSSTVSVERKLELLEGVDAGETAIVLFDAYRCSSTVLACFAAGISGAFVKEKVVSSGGVDVATAQKLADQAGVQLILGGEFDGKPVPGGIIGNSPIDAFRHDISGALLHFQSTNFGRLFARLTRYIEDLGGAGDLFVMSFANAQATARHVREGRYERVIVAAAGFFECLAIEDMVVGGEFLHALGRPATDCDDDALAMVAAHLAFDKDDRILRGSWTARVLQELSKADDIDDVLHGRRLPAEATARLRSIVLKVEKIGQYPVIRQARTG